MAAQFPSNFAGATRKSCWRPPLLLRLRKPPGDPSALTQANVEAGLPVVKPGGTGPGKIRLRVQPSGSKSNVEIMKVPLFPPPSTRAAMEPPTLAWSALIAIAMKYVPVWSGGDVVRE